MRKIISIMLLLNLTLLNAIMLEKETTKIARCSGIIKANSYIDYSISNISRAEMLDSIKIANSLYFKKILEGNYTREEALQYDILSASAMDELVRSANNETFGTAEYEEVISCYKVFSSSLLKNVVFDEKINSILNKISNENIHNIDVILGK